MDGYSAHFSFSVVKSRLVHNNCTADFNDSERKYRMVGTMTIWSVCLSEKTIFLIFLSNPSCI